MNKKLFIYILLIFSKITFGQINLVPNPSFEQYNNCPDMFGLISYASSWNNKCILSPDYFNTCCINAEAGVPFNFGGYQNASTGNAYIGIGTYSNMMNNSDFREYFGAQLTNTLIVGTKYFFSIKICLAFNPAANVKANTATNNIGAKFSQVNKTTYVCDNNPKINFNTVITDTINWTHCQGSFIADSAYKYIIIGNFYDNANTQKINLNSDPNKSAYYYIDDICLSTDSLLASISTNINEETLARKSVLFPNPTKDYIYVNISDKSPINRLVMYNSHGEQIILENNLINNKIDVSSILEGIYLVQILCNSRIYYEKIIIKH